MLSRTDSKDCINDHDDELIQKHRSGNDKVSSTPGFHLLQLVHDAQNLQLCAVHTLNNLLQLTKSEHEKVILMVQGKTCNLDESKMSALRTYGTKFEFDMIADKLTYQEKQLFSTQDCSIQNNFELGGTRLMKMSLWSKLKSSHRTPICGNYSFEVLQIALMNRNVELEWYQASKDKRALKDKNGQVLLGYIVNEKQPVSFFAPYRLFFESRHWFAITCVRWACKTDNSNDSKVTNEQNTPNNKTQFSKSGWFMIDSQMNKIRQFDSDVDVDNYLSKYDQVKSSIFRAWLQI